MSHALPIADPIQRRRGACPSLDAPMQTGDGLLARLRIIDGRLTPAALIAIARLAREHGNGLIEITARGNLQVRGLTEGSRRPFAAAVQDIVAIDSGLVVETPPLTGDDPTERADPRPLAAAIREAASPFADRLGPKVTVIVDGAGQIGLSNLKADIRLVASDESSWSLTVGNGSARILPTQSALAQVNEAIAAIAALGFEARAVDLASSSQPPASDDAPIPVGSFASSLGNVIGIALPFGAADTNMLIELAGAAAAAGITELRLGPHHTLLAIGASPAFSTAAAVLGFVTSAADPRLRISACIGSDGCASGHIPARQIGQRLAASLPAGRVLHVSGCAKGCAHPRAADLTVVGRSDGYGLVISGTAGDMPRAVLAADQLESAIGARQG